VSRGVDLFVTRDRGRIRRSAHRRPRRTHTRSRAARQRHEPRITRSTERRPWR
jgi:hypothetical protein